MLNLIQHSKSYISSIFCFLTEFRGSDDSKNLNSLSYPNLSNGKNCSKSNFLKKSRVAHREITKILEAYFQHPHQPEVQHIRFLFLSPLVCIMVSLIVLSPISGNSTGSYNAGRATFRAGALLFSSSGIHKRSQNLKSYKIEAYAVYSGKAGGE